MARIRTTTSSLPRPILLTSVGMLTHHVPLAQVMAVLDKLDKAGERDRLLPAPFLVYLVIALSLYMPYPLREVLRCVLDGLRHLHAAHVPGGAIATKGAISRGRSRLGSKVMAELFAAIARPLATPKTRGAWYQHWRLVGLDGTTMSLDATEANEAAFGAQASRAGAGAFPLLRLAALVEVGTHAVLKAEFDACAIGELTLAERLLPGLTADMLVLEDRGFLGYTWFQQVRATGAHVICRQQVKMHFPVQRRLPDGSFLSVLRPPVGHAGDPIPVRVIEYTLHGVPGADPVYRLVTSLLNPAVAPAGEVAALYHERWEGEGTFDEFQTHIRGGADMRLRSKTPDLVRQEVYGLLLAHYVVRAVMHDAACQVEEDPDRLSFVHTVRVLRRS